jgi:hypothetical protein
MVTAGFIMVFLIYPFCSIDVGGFAMLKRYVFPRGLDSYRYVCAMMVSAYIQDRVCMAIVRAEVKKMARFSRYIGGKVWGKDCLLMIISSAGPSGWLCGVLVWSGYLFQALGYAGFSTD